MIGFALLLVFVGIAAGPVLAPIDKVGLRRILGWSVVLGLLAGAHVLVDGDDPIIRMIVICSVLLGAMKGMVYAEWAQREQLPLGNYLVFAFCWFGMDPQSFRKRKKGLTWREDIVWGIGLMMVGTLGGWLVWCSGNRQILVMFVPMSLGFHFGALRVLKGVHRLAGFPVRTLFPNLLKATGNADFWSRRWNVGYSQMMQRIVGRPVEAKAGKAWGIMAVFLMSGLFHEIAITLPVNAGFGLPTIYFVCHGLLVLLEMKFGKPLGKVVTLLAVGLPLGILFPPEFQKEVIERCLSVMEVFL